MIVTIPIAESQGIVHSKTINIRDYCPVCGAKRGSATDSGNNKLSNWRNPCGHGDSYYTVFEEYLRRMNFQHRGRGDKYEPTFENIFKTNRIITNL